MVRTPTEYVEGLRDQREVWYRGRKVSDVTNHPVLGRCVSRVAREYELQHVSEYQDLLTTLDSSGHRVSRAYHIPRTCDDLAQRRQMIEFLAFKAGGGVTDRFRESVASVLLGLLNCKDKFHGSNVSWAENIQTYFEHCKSKDLFVSLAVVDPKGDRSKPPHQQHDPDLYLRAVSDNKEGLIVRGAKSFATAAAYADEIYVAPSMPMTDKDKDYVLAFAIPADIKGVKIVCRGTHSLPDEGSFDRPLASNWDEIDSLVIFDDTLVPWDRVFLYKDHQLLDSYFRFANWCWFAYSFVSRTFAKADLLTGASYLMADYNGLANVPPIQQQLAELITYAETLRSYLRVAEVDCTTSDSGITMPNLRAISTARSYAAENYRRIVQVAQELAGAAMAVSPTAEDLRNDRIGPYIRKYYLARAGVTAEKRLRMFKLLFDLTSSSFAGHKELFEIFAQGPLPFLRSVLYNQQDMSWYTKKVEQVLETADLFSRETP